MQSDEEQAESDDADAKDEQDWKDVGAVAFDFTVVRYDLRSNRMSANTGEGAIREGEASVAGGEQVEPNQGYSQYEGNVVGIEFPVQCEQDDGDGRVRATNEHVRRWDPAVQKSQMTGERSRGVESR